MIKKIVSSIIALTVVLCVSITFAADVKFSDINDSHWASEYIFELVSKGTVNGYPDGTFKPSGTVTYAEFEKMITGKWNDNPIPINREAALDMLWRYNDSPKSDPVPAIIANQMLNPDAVAWGYNTGLMQGSDGLNLRAADTLTRAEAAKLIILAKSAKSGGHSFADSVDDKITKEIWRAYNIFDSEYKPEDTITAEELEKAATKLGDFRKLNIEVKSATVEDAAILLIYSAVCRENISVSVGDLSVISDKYGKLPQIYAAYGLEKGIVLPDDKKAAATKRDIALLLLQLDDLIGKDGVKINKDVTNYPKNYTDFAYLQEGVPLKAYSTAFDNKAKPVDFYKFVSDFDFIFETFIDEMNTKYGSDKVKITLIPSLVSQNSKTEAILRVKCELTGTASASSIFGDGYKDAGKSFYMDIHTGEPILSIHIPEEFIKIGKFICND